MAKKTYYCGSNKVTLLHREGNRAWVQDDTNILGYIVWYDTLKVIDELSLDDLKPGDRFKFPNRAVYPDDIFMMVNGNRIEPDNKRFLFRLVDHPSCGSHDRLDHIEKNTIFYIKKDQIDTKDEVVEKV